MLPLYKLLNLRIILQSKAEKSLSLAVGRMSSRYHILTCKQVTRFTGVITFLNWTPPNYLDWIFSDFSLYDKIT